MKTEIVEQGMIITFYSFKGGTGRSMATANIACLMGKKLSAAKKKVLLIDWDLDAPGLQKFFPRAESDENKEKPGIIEYFSRARQLLTSQPSLYADISGDRGLERFRETLPLDPFIVKDVEEGVDLIKAGVMTRDYAQRIAEFDWAGLFTRFSSLAEVFRSSVGEQYPYCLIDSRTGVSDVGGIATFLLPEKLVTVFTPNHQSLSGALDLAERAVNYRRASDDLRPLAVFPLPSRVELSERELRDKWRRSYQSDYEELFRRVYGLSECDLNGYFDDVQIPHVSYYAYGEEIAALEVRNEALSLKRAYEAFYERLVNLAHAWADASDGVEADSRAPSPPENRGVKRGFDRTLDALESGRSRFVGVQLDEEREQITSTWQSMYMGIRSQPTIPVAEVQKLLRTFDSVGGTTLAIARVDEDGVLPEWNRFLESILRLSEGREGFESVLSLPGIPAGFLYMAACASSLHWNSWTVMQRLLWDKFEWYYMSGRPLYDFGFNMASFFHPEALRREAPAAHNLYRSVLGDPEYSRVVGLSGEDLFTLYVQTQMIQCLRSAQHAETNEDRSIWADFGRFRQSRVLPLLDRVFQDSRYAEGLCSTFKETPSVWKTKLNARLEYVRLNYFRGAPYSWDSIREDYKPRKAEE